MDPAYLNTDGRTIKGNPRGVYPSCRPVLGAMTPPGEPLICERCGDVIRAGEYPCRAIPVEKRWGPDLAEAQTPQDSAQEAPGDVPPAGGSCPLDGLRIVAPWFVREGARWVPNVRELELLPWGNSGGIDPWGRWWRPVEPKPKDRYAGAVIRPEGKPVKCWTWYAWIPTEEVIHVEERMARHEAGTLEEAKAEADKALILLLQKNGYLPKE